MSKKLSPLEAISDLKELRNVFVGHCRELNYKDNYIEVCEHKFDCIETALKEKEQQDSVFKTLKEIIEFAQMLPQIKPNEDNGFDIMSAVTIKIQRDIENKERELLRQWILETCFPKELKALEIIITKKVNVWCVSRVSLEEYNTKFVNQDWRQLTQEEYDLLKGVLL